MKGQSLSERYWSKVRIAGPDECWEWQAGKHSYGYGKFWVDGKTRGAHQVAWEWANHQEVPRGMVVRHTCDNPACVNPAHLLLGQQTDNVRDRDERGRTACGLRNGAYTHPNRRPTGPRNGKHTKPERTARGARNGRYTRPERTARGETNGYSKLTAAQVIEIRRRYRAGGVTFKCLGSEYGVTGVNIRYIVAGRTWRHLLQEGQ